MQGINDRAAGHAVRTVWLIGGLILLGQGIALFARSDLGLPVWGVLHDAISRRTGMLLGTADIVVACALLLTWLPLRLKPGPGTLLNLFLVGLSTNAALAYLPEARSLVAQGAALTAGVIGLSVGIGLYLAAGYGPGVRDGVMIVLHQRTRWPIWLVRIGIDATVVVIGALLGGSYGVGTFVCVVASGPIVDATLWLVDRTGRVRRRH